MADTSEQKCVARALYDNAAESPDELSFKKGDLLTVLEQNTAGLEGWWLCALRGRQGICPGNRLRLLAGVYDFGHKFNDDNSGTDTSLEQQGHRRSWHVQPNRVITPQKLGDVYLYDLPRNVACYDYPAPGQPIPVCQNIRSWNGSRPGSGSSGSTEWAQTYDMPRIECYDVPRAVSPCSSTSSFAASSADSSSNRSSVAADYDVPRPRLRDDISWQMSLQQTTPCAPVPLINPKELQLELHLAIESAERLENEATNAINKLLSYVSPTWRDTEYLESKIDEIRVAAIRFRTALHELYAFSEGVLGNALNSADKGLAKKVTPLVKTFCETNTFVHDITRRLDSIQWSAQMIGRFSDPKSDPLDRLIVCARNLTEDIRLFASFVQGNATLLFKRQLTDADDSSKLNENDYANIDAYRILKKQHSETNGLLPDKSNRSHDFTDKDIENEIATDEVKRNEMSCSDRKTLSLYADQCDAHSTDLTRAIDALLLAVERNEPPKELLSRGKPLVVCAYRLVTAADAAARSVGESVVGERIVELADALADCLNVTVRKIRAAAEQFPNVNAVQEMVDSVVDVSHAARDVKMHVFLATHV